MMLFACVLFLTLVPCLYLSKVLHFVTSSLQVGRDFENQWKMNSKCSFLILIVTNFLTSMVILVVVQHAPQTCSVPSVTVQTHTVTTVKAVLIQEKEFEKRCISYSLYKPSDSGVITQYTEGFLHNVELAKLLYPQWKIKLYLDFRIKGSEFHKTVNEYEKVDIIWMESNVTGNSGHVEIFSG